MAAFGIIALFAGLLLFMFANQSSRPNKRSDGRSSSSVASRSDDWSYYDSSDDSDDFSDDGGSD